MQDSGQTERGRAQGRGNSVSRQHGGILLRLGTTRASSPEHHHSVDAPCICTVSDAGRIVTKRNCIACPGRRWEMDQPFFARLNVVLQDLPPYSGAGQTPFLTAPALIVSDPIFCRPIFCRPIFCRPVMRKLAHLIYGVIKSGKPFDANFCSSGVAFQDGI